MKDSELALNKIISSHSATQKALEIIKEVADDCETESEYDGRMEASCFYCASELNAGDGYDKSMHDNDCTHVKARELLKFIEDCWPHPNKDEK